MVAEHNGAWQAWVKGAFVGGCDDGPEAWMGVVPMVRSGKLAEMLAA